jgi:DNA repair exonuclease SbcCD ATPase subunit
MTAFFEQVRRKGEERLGLLTGQLLGNERFMSALETALSTKGYVERKVKTLLHTMSVASRLDVDELGQRLAEAERRLRQLTRRLETLQAQVEDLAARGASMPAGSDGASAAEPAPVEPAEAASSVAAEPAAAERASSAGAAPPSAGAAPGASLPPASGAAPAAGMQAVCPVCGKTFQKKTYNQRFCSAACRSGVS